MRVNLNHVDSRTLYYALCTELTIRDPSVTFVIFLCLVRWIWGMTTCALRQRVPPFLSPWPTAFRLRSSPALSENPPEHRATPVLLRTKRNYTRGLSAVFVFPFFPVSFRSFARGGRWTTEAGRNQPRRAKSRPTDEISRGWIVEKIFHFWQIKVRTPQD